MTTKPSPAGKNRFKERTHSFKLKVVQEIENGLISRHYAAKKYLASRSSIDYWCKKLGTDMNQENNHSTNKKIKKLEAKIEELEFMNLVRKDAIAAMLKLLGEEGKNSYAKQLEDIAREIERRK